MRHTSTARPAQESREVSGVKARDKFITQRGTDKGLTRAYLSVGVRLAIFFNCTTGQCNPGDKLLAQETGLSVRTVVRAIGALAERGWVTAQRHAGNSEFKLFLQPIGKVTSAVTSPPAVTSVTAEGQSDKNGTCEVTSAVTTKNTEKRTLKDSLRDELRSSPVVEYEDRVEVDRPVALAAGGGEPLTDDQAEGFEQAAATYPRDRIGDTAKAQVAFCKAIRAGHTTESIIEQIDGETFGRDVADLPFLADLLHSIAATPAELEEVAW